MVLCRGLSRAFVLVLILLAPTTLFAQSEELLAEVQSEQKACAANDANACYELGLKHRNGEGVPNTYKEALALFEQACDSDHAAACYELGEMHHLGEGAKQDMDYIIELYSKACKGNNVDSC